MEARYRNEESRSRNDRQDDDVGQASERFEIDLLRHYQPFNQLRVSASQSHYWTNHPTNLRFMIKQYAKRENGTECVYRHLSDELDLYYGRGWEDDAGYGRWTKIFQPRTCRRKRQEAATSQQALVELFLKSDKSMSDFLARRTEYFQDCQQVLEAGLAEAKTKVASALSRFMSERQGGKETDEDWLEKIERRLESTTIWLHDPLSLLVGLDINDWLDSNIPGCFELTDRRIGVPFRSFLTHPKNIGDIITHEVMHAAGVIALHEISPDSSSGVSDTEQSRSPKIRSHRSGLHLAYSSVESETRFISHGTWLDESLIDSFGFRHLGFIEPVYLYEVIALRTLDGLQPGLEDALLEAAVGDSSPGPVFAMVENWLGPFGIERMQEKWNQIRHPVSGRMVPEKPPVPGRGESTFGQSEFLGDYFLGLLAPNVCESERKRAGRIWAEKTEEIFIQVQENWDKIAVEYASTAGTTKSRSIIAG